MISSISDLKTDMLNIALYSETVNCMSRRLYKKYFTFYMAFLITSCTCMFQKNTLLINIIAIKFLNSQAGRAKFYQLRHGSSTTFATKLRVTITIQSPPGHTGNSAV